MSKSTRYKWWLSVCGVAIAIATALLWHFGSAKDFAEPKNSVSSEDFVPSAQQRQSNGGTIPIGAQILLDVYPDYVKGYQDGKLLMADGSSITYDDQREKSFVEKLDDADPEDMFSFKYDRKSWTPGLMQDAGRSRCEALFKMMYGNSASQVTKNLVSVSWFGENLKFSKVNHAADSLRAVAAEITGHPELRAYLKSSGTFYWRKVRGANRQSAHSYGIAIDIGVKNSDYWLWNNPGKKETDKIEYVNRMPHLLVEIFERHGFIWGGRWYHYDTMHFEFRPEIINQRQ